MSCDVVVLGSFVADVAFRTRRLPKWGETFMGETFALGPGGKGSNQAVAAARAGAKTCFISKLGEDAFGRLARDTYAAEGIDTEFVFQADCATGAAAIIIDEERGENAIIVVPGACYTITPEEVDRAERAIASAKVFVAQLELPISVVEHGLRLAKKHGVTTVLNPAPAASLPESIFALVDYLVPNETECSELTGMSVATDAEAEQAADVLLKRGASNIVVTLGERGALLRNVSGSCFTKAVSAGSVVETTGAGDAFCGGFAAALAEGRAPQDAMRFGCAVAGISVTRAGTAPSMPKRSEVDDLLARS
ncbi:MAG: ribokinase [Acidobacteria bacterium]|nr:ribokinase [Acidobacteriota bacterium]